MSWLATFRIVSFIFLTNGVVITTVIVFCAKEIIIITYTTHAFVKLFWFKTRFNLHLIETYPNLLSITFLEKVVCGDELQQNLSFPLSLCPQICGGEAFKKSI